jgi:hypothetical protein
LPTASTCGPHDGESIVEHLAGVEEFTVALATYKAAHDKGRQAGFTRGCH